MAKRKKSKKSKSGPKKPRTAKQKAATRALIALNKSKSKPRKKTSSRSKRSGSSTMAKKKRSTTSRAKGFLGGVTKNPTVRKAAMGAGFAALATAGLSVVSPQLANNPIVRAIAGFAGGDVTGAIAAFIANPQTLQMIAGSIQQATGFSFGGGGGMNQQMMMTGFA